MAASVRPPRASCGKQFSLKLSPRVTNPVEIVSRTPITNETGPSSFFSPGTSLTSNGTPSAESLRKGGAAALIASFPMRRVNSTQQPPSSSNASSSCVSPALSASTSNRVYSSFRASKIVTNLWLGSDEDAMNLEVLRQNNIHYILNVAKECRPSREVYDACDFVGHCTPAPDDGAFVMASPEMVDFDIEMRPGTKVGSSFPSSVCSKPISYMYIPLTDNVDAPIQDHFHAANLFLRAALEQGKGVLVHCRMGVSRSASFVIAYLMQFGMNLKKPNRISFEEALHRVQSVRPSVSPNIGFGAALRDLDAELRVNEKQPASDGERETV